MTSPIDFIDISVIVECSPSNDKDPKKVRSCTVGKARISLAELALFMDDVNHEKTGKPLTFAVEMDYLPNDLLKKVEPDPNEKPIKRYGYDSLKEEHNHKNLLSSRYTDKMILVLDASYVADVIKGSRDLKFLKSIGNKFILPEVVSHKDTINQSYDQLIKKQK